MDEVTVERSKMVHRNKVTWLVLLLLGCLAFYSTYVLAVIPPQTGWWQYMAQRLSAGDLLYKDVFVYVPPYFVGLTTVLYQLFQTHFILYTVFGLIFFRLIPAMLSYLLMLRYTRPPIAATAVLVGVCLTSSYLMDQSYDYNPLIMALTLLQTYLLVRTYESKSNKSFYGLVAVQGILCGTQIMLKQNTGIVLPLLIFLLTLWVTAQRDKCMCGQCIIAFGLGVLVGITPAIIYLMATRTLMDFWWCITTSLGAKIGEGNLIEITVRNFIQAKDIPATIALILVYCLATSSNNTAKQFLAPASVLLSIVLTFMCSKYVRSICEYMNQFGMFTRVFLISIVVFACVLGIVSFFRFRKKETRTNLLGAGFFLSLLGLSIILRSRSTIFGEYFYETFGWAELKKHILYTLLYFDIFLWIHSVYCLLAKKEERRTSFLLIYTVFLGFLAVSFMSATLEELYALLLIPGFFAACEELFPDNGVQCAGSVVSRGLLAEFMLCVCVLICGLSINEKLYIPYEWHSWRTPNLLEKANAQVKINVDGLEGFRVPASDAMTYEKIVSLIEENSTESDVLFQFPNIPLFNVLTGRKTLYIAIPYFDVCPDTLAVECAEGLYTNPPKLFLYANLSESRWLIHEEAFRNGMPSGQREIQRFYTEYVTQNYELLGIFDNNEGETLELWKRN